MAGSPRRHRRSIATAVLGLWLFAVFVGIANACSCAGLAVVSQPLHLGVHAEGDGLNDGVAPGCDAFGSNDISLAGVLQPIQGRPGAPPLVIAMYRDFHRLSISAPILRLARLAHPSPGVPFALRIVHLTL